jgi:hypothetical protein
MTVLCAETWGLAVRTGYVCFRVSDLRAGRAGDYKIRPLPLPPPPILTCHRTFLTHDATTGNGNFNYITRLFCPFAPELDSPVQCTGVK